MPGATSRSARTARGSRCTDTLWNVPIDTRPVAPARVSSTSRCADAMCRACARPDGSSTRPAGVKGHWFRTTGAIEQRGAQEPFEGRHLLADAGLAIAEFVGCSAEGSFARDGHHGGQLSKRCLLQSHH